MLGNGEIWQAARPCRAHKFSRVGARQDRSGRRPLRGARPQVLESLRNIFAIPDLRKRLPVHLRPARGLPDRLPHSDAGIDPRALMEFMNAAQNTFLGFVNTFTGGSLQRVAVFALGIMPYITASIILQLLTVVWPYLEKLSKEGEIGRREDHPVHALRHGAGLDHPVDRYRAVPREDHDARRRRPGSRLRAGRSGSMTVLTLTTGCAFIMWLGEQISERGVGNGISLIIFAGIVVGLPRTRSWTRSGRCRANELSMIAIVLPAWSSWWPWSAFIVYMERAQRRIPVQYAKRMVGRKVYGGQTHLPAAAGQHRRRHPGHLRELGDDGCRRRSAQMAQGTAWLQKMAGTSSPGGSRSTTCCTSSGIIFFSYFYISIIFNPIDLAENMRKYGELHPRHPLGQAHGRVHRPHPDADHAGRRDLPGAGLDPPRLPAQRRPHPEPAVDRAGDSIPTCPTG